MKITVTDYMSRSPKGRACQPRKTTYLVATEDRTVAEAKVIRTHLRRIAQGALEAPVKVAATTPATVAQATYQIL